MTPTVYSPGLYQRISTGAELVKTHSDISPIPRQNFTEGQSAKCVYVL